MNQQYFGYRIFLIGLVLSILLCTVISDEHERRLYDYLLADYNTLERPVENNSMPVDVKLQIVLNQLIDVDEKNQIIQTNIWLRYEWHDVHLQWDPAEFGGVADVRIPMGKIWRPDILLYNSVDQSFDSTFGVNHVVYNNGIINWLPPGIVKSSCTIDITWFPFDEQTCHFKFSSWTYGGFKLNLSQLETGWDVSEYIENGEWLLIGHSVQRKVSKYECCPDPYIDMYFYFVIRRRTLYYGFNMIMPSLIVSLMTLLGFALPVESGEKVTLEITILLSVCVFLSMVANMTPPTSEALPLIGIFFSCNMILVALSVVCCVVVLNFHYRTPDTHTMSPMMREIMLNWLPWFLMMKRPGHKFTRGRAYTSGGRAANGACDSVLLNGDSLDRRIRHSDDSMYVAFSPCSPLLTQQDPTTPNPPPLGRIPRLYSADTDMRILSCLRSLTNNPRADQATLALLLTIQQIQAEVKFMAQRMAREDDVQEAKNDWRFAAMVVDRLCLVLFSILIIVSTCGIFFAAPYIVA